MHINISKIPNPPFGFWEDWKKKSTNLNNMILVAPITKEL